jgi:hypothetical protein
MKEMNNSLNFTSLKFLDSELKYWEGNHMRTIIKVTRKEIMFLWQLWNISNATSRHNFRVFLNFIII